MSETCGLLDCCIETIRRYDGPVEEGDYLDCEFCPVILVFREGAYELSEMEAL